MFVFKAAVVGAGTMGGEIAQTIAAAGIPVVLKDVEQEFVDEGLDEARKVTEGQLGRLVKKEKITAGAGRRPGRGDPRPHPGTTEYEGFGDVDFVIEAVPERMEIKQAVFAELDAVTPGHAILASNTSSLSITEIGEATLRPDKVVGFHFFYPASVMRLIEVDRGRRDLAPRRCRRPSTSPRRSARCRSRCAEVPGLRRQPHPQLGGRRDLARAGGERACRSRRSTRASATPRRAPMGPFFLVDLLGLDTVCTSPSTCTSPTATASTSTRAWRSWSQQGKLGAKTGGEGFYDHGEPNIEGDAEPARRARRALRR